VGHSTGIPSYMVDISKMPEIVAILNNIINNGGIAEIKNEKRKGLDNIVVVEITRSVKTRKPN